MDDTKVKTSESVTDPSPEEGGGGSFGSSSSLTTDSSDPNIPSSILNRSTLDSVAAATTTTTLSSEFPSRSCSPTCPTDLTSSNPSSTITTTTTTTLDTNAVTLGSTSTTTTSSSSSSTSNSGLSGCTDGKEMPLSTKKPSGQSSSSLSSSATTNKGSSLTPVPNIKPIISITPVLSSPAISKPMGLGSEKGWDLSHTSIVSALHNQSHGHSRHHHHRRKPSTAQNAALTVSRSSSPCQLAPMALTTTGSAVPTALNLVTNGKVQSGSLSSDKQSSVEKPTLSDFESHMGDSSEGSVSSDNSYVSSDNDCENGESGSKGRTTGGGRVMRPPRLLPDGRNESHTSSRLSAAARSNLDAVMSGMALTLDVPSSITLTPLGSASPPLNSPLNLSMKKPTVSNDDFAPSSAVSSISTFNASLSQRGAKRGPKPKHLRGLSALTAEENQLRQRQASLEELKAQLEAQLKQQQMQLRLARKTSFVTQTTSPPQIHIQATSSRGKPCIITKNTSPSSSAASSSSALPPLSSTILALTKGLSTRSVSLLSGSRSPDFASTSSSHLKRGNYGQSKLSTTSNGALSLIPMDVSEDGLTDRERKLVAKFRTLDAESSDNESTDDEDSSGETGDSSSGSDSTGESGSTSSDTEASSGRGQKRGYSSEGSSPTKKSRRIVISDERELRIPLEHGWRRLTKIRTYSFSGARGEVVYFAPCGKKLKTYPEVVRYLEKNGINDIGRENFSFSAKHNVGEYLEPQGNGEYSEIGEGEVVARIEEFRARKGRRYIPVAMRRKMEEKHRRREEARLRRRLEQQGCMPEKVAQKEPEKKVTLRKRRVREKATRSARDTRLLQAAEARRQKDHVRFLRQQEKVEKQEQLRIEKEMRSHQMLEVQTMARKKRQELLEKQRIEETERKNKEREMKKLQAVVMREQELQKRREMLIMVDLERERRRQHMLLVKALETRKRQEERERMREERLEEKRVSRERKMEQRQLEMLFIREMKKPVEDMELKDPEPLPILNRIPGVKLPGQAFADVLMVFEFLHNFGEALGFDMDGLPTLNTLQMALLNDESCEDEFLSVLHHLLTCAIEDPGIPSGPKGKTALNQHLREVDITFGTVSEVLRIFIRATEGPNSKFFEWLSEKPFMALNGSQKASILAHLCNELLCSRAICRQIDNNIDAVNNVKRDKWMVEGKVRKLRMIHARKVARQQMKANYAIHRETEADGSKATPIKDVKNEDDDDIVNNSENESDASHCDADEPDEEPSVSVDDLEKKIDKMTKQHNQFRRKLMKATQQLRAVSLGQDRYRRRYWVLPTVGGVFVEGLESTNLHCDYPEERATKVEVKVENDSKDDTAIKAAKESVQTSAIELKAETVNPGESVIKEEVIVKNEDVKVKDEDVKTEIETKDESGHLLLPNSGEVSKLNDYVEKEGEAVESAGDNKVAAKSTTPSPPPPQSVPGPPKDITPFSHGIFPSFGMDPRFLFNSPFNFHGNGELNEAVFNMAGKCFDGNVSASDYCMGLFPVPQCQINAEQIMKTFGDRLDEKPWFSILPRMPCDETSLTRLQQPPNASTTDKDATTLVTCDNRENANTVPKTTVAVSSPIPCSLPKYPPIQFSPFYFHNGPSFGSLQMGLINGSSSPFLGPHFMSSSPMGLNGSGMSNTDCSLLNTPNGPLPFAMGISPSVWSPALRQQYAALQDLQQQQYSEPQSISAELQKGWWRITDANQLKALVQSLHSRGIREKMLQLKLQKYLDLTSEVCSKGGQYGALDLEITDLDKEIATKFAGAPDLDDETTWSRNVVMRMDMAILEQVENLEEKVASASMQLKHWKLPTKITEEEGIKFHLVCDEPSFEDGEEEPIDCESTPKSVCALTIARERLLGLEAAIERRYVKPPLGYSLASMSSVGNHHHHNHHYYQHHHHQQQSNGHSNEGGGVNSNGDTPQDESPPSPIFEEAPKGLLVWRAAVRNSTTSSQLAVCLNYLEGSVAWDRSIMKASCQFCNSGDNEAMLLLCDGCDKGYHTYCFKPKMESIPEGDWFCYECLNKATGDRVCLFCGKKGKNLCLCDNCPKAYHTDCLDPPMARVPKTKWHCPQCNNKTMASKIGKHNKNRKSKETLNLSVAEVDDSPRKTDKSPGASSRADRCKERNKNSSNRDLGPCRDILAELEAHEDAWPFLLPVNTKQFPSYRKVIKRLMDLSTIRSKLDGGTYRSRSDFVFDTRLMFNNCETFNEDDSPVGKAGHNLRSFFETLWSDIADK